MFRKTLAVFAAASLTLSPTLAQAAVAPAATPDAVQRSAAAGSGSQLQGGNWFVPALAALIVLLGVLTATGVIFDDDDEQPVSP